MTIGVAIFLAAFGAILRFAVDDNLSGIDLAAVGTILIVAGVVGLVVGLALAMFGREPAPRTDRERVRERW